MMNQNIPEQIDLQDCPARDSREKHCLHDDSDLKIKIHGPFVTLNEPMVIEVIRAIDKCCFCGLRFERKEPPFPKPPENRTI